MRGLVHTKREPNPVFWFQGASGGVATRERKRNHEFERGWFWGGVHDGDDEAEKERKAGCERKERTS